MNLGIDCSEFSYLLRDRVGNEVKLCILIVVHPEVYCVLGSHIASPNIDYIQEFLDKILDILKNRAFRHRRILVKKTELF